MGILFFLPKKRPIILLSPFDRRQNFTAYYVTFGPKTYLIGYVDLVCVK